MAGTSGGSPVQGKKGVGVEDILEWHNPIGGINCPVLCTYCICPGEKPTVVILGMAGNFAELRSPVSHYILGCPIQYALIAVKVYILHNVPVPKNVNDTKPCPLRW